MRVLIFSFMVALMGIKTAYAQSAVEQACKIRSAMLSAERNTTTIEELVAQFAWNKQMPAQRIKAALATLGTFSYQSVEVFNAVKVGTFHQTLLIVGSLPENSPIFIELRYQTVNNKVRLINVNFKDQLEKLYAGLNPGTQLDQLNCS